jgi:murein DD-endopeptidase MepM/ murein hydrolase activator NlpD
MPDIRVHRGISRRVRLPALVTSITLISGAAAASSQPGRLRYLVREVRRLRARAALRRREIDLERDGPTVITADDGSMPTLWPVNGVVTSPFGWRPSPYDGQREWHRGVDIRAPYGTPVRAAAEGEVTFAGRVSGYGALVVLEHGPVTTRYAHLSAIWVHAGEAVVRGQSVGALGGTGRATGPHLHYEVRLGDEPLDPECLLAGAARARLARASHACALTRARLDRATSRMTARNGPRPAALRLHSEGS